MCCSCRAQEPRGHQHHMCGHGASLPAKGSGAVGWSPRAGCPQSPCSPSSSQAAGSPSHASPTPAVDATGCRRASPACPCPPRRPAGLLPAPSACPLWTACWRRCPAARRGSVLACRGSWRALVPCSAPSTPAWGGGVGARTLRGCRSGEVGDTGPGGRAEPSLQEEPWRPDCPAGRQGEAVATAHGGLRAAPRPPAAPRSGAATAPDAAKALPRVPGAPRAAGVNAGLGHRRRAGHYPVGRRELAPPLPAHAWGEKLGQGAARSSREQGGRSRGPQASPPATASAVSQAGRDVKRPLGTQETEIN